MGVFGFECTLDRVIEELKSYNDFSIHRVIILDPVNASFYFVMYLKI
jgi:SWI/SNF-related matrix-associated actin-dependent regulator 1 of chromatin subfamily A